MIPATLYVVWYPQRTHTQYPDLVEEMHMKEQKPTKPQYDTMKAFTAMGVAVDVLMKAAFYAFEHAVVAGKEQQGKPRRRKAV